MKIPLLLASVWLATAAYAQTTLVEKPIQDAMTLLRASDTMIITLDGSDVVGPRTTSLSSTAFWQWNSLDPLGKMYADIFEFTNGSPSRRVTANGVTVFGYTNSTNSYTSNAYGLETNPQPSDFKQNLMQALATESQGTTVFVTRFLREVFGGDVATYRTWLPGATPVGIYNGMVQDDPVSNRKYAPGQDDFYIWYSYPNRMMRSNAFHLVRKDATSPFEIKEIFYTDLSKVGNMQRVVDWTMNINPVITSTTNYKFVPPPTARAISNRRTGG